jgi:hypothetical protein
VNAAPLWWVVAFCAGTGGIAIALGWLYVQAWRRRRSASSA